MALRIKPDSVYSSTNPIRKSDQIDCQADERVSSDKAAKSAGRMSDHTGTVSDHTGKVSDHTGTFNDHTGT